MASGKKNEIFALIVDDDDVDRERLARMLEHCTRPIHVLEAASQAEALALIRKPSSHFDIVFLDFGLEDGDGRDLVPTIHGEVDPDCPIVAVTGFADELVAAASIKAGMTEFLTKRSLSPERVAASVEEGIAWRKYRQDMRRADEELTHRSLHDGLTDLPNRTLFLDRLSQNTARARRDGDPFAVAMIDLDGFKGINDSFGHLAGDAVLEAIGRRLRAHLREVDTVARIGGDEFAVLLHNVSTPEAAMAMATKLAGLIGQPVVHEGQALKVACSIGVALCPQLGFSSDGLLAAADDAMYEAKRGMETAVIARGTGARHGQSFDRTGMQLELEDALVRQTLDWHWQPKIDLLDGQVLGFEALVRWRDPRGELVPAERVIHAIEQSPLLEEFTYHCLETVLGQFARMQRDLDGAAICINISARAIELPGFVDGVASCVERHGIDPDRVILELTETTLITNPSQAKRVIEELCRQHIAFSIDDFGAGFTSFGYLREFPVSEIKVDRSYIRRFTESRFDQSLVQSLVVLCESLGIMLVAEGVEDARTREMLVAMGCHAGQGFGICPPIPCDEVRDWISDWNRSRISSAA
jgi:diguanylate cyclase (GGDEF)-like protein